MWNLFMTPKIHVHNFLNLRSVWKTVLYMEKYFGPNEFHTKRVILVL